MKLLKHVLAPTPRYLMRLNFIQEILDNYLENIQSFLEVGPGLGDTSEYLLNAHPDSKGDLIEFSELATEQLRERFSKSNRIQILSEDITKIKQNKEYDLVLAFEVLEHIKEDSLLIQEISSILKANGKFIMSVPAFMNKWELGDDWAGHYRRYEKEEVLDKIRSAGLRVDLIWNYGFPLSNILYPVRQLYYRRNKQQANKEEASKISGIHRPTKNMNPKTMHNLIRPMLALQKHYRNSNLGDGWILLATKI